MKVVFPPFKRRSRSILTSSAAFVLLGLASAAAPADTFYWVGEAAETEASETGSLGGLFDEPFFPLASASQWTAGVGLKKNWSRNGQTPSVVPDTQDIVVFGNGFESGNPTSTISRTIQELQFSMVRDILIDFQPPDTSRETLTITSGIIRRSSFSAGNQVIRADVVLNGTNALMDLKGTGALAIKGNLIADNLTKRGTAELRFDFQNAAPILQGTTRVEEGKFSILTNTANPIALVVGTEAPSSPSAEFNSNGQHLISSLVVENNGVFRTMKSQTMFSLNMHGGDLFAGFASGGARMFVNAGVVNASAGLTGSTVNPSRFISASYTPGVISRAALDFSFSPGGVGTINTQAVTFNGQTTVDALVIDCLITASTLNFTGNGKTSMVDPSPTVSQYTLNEIGATNVQSGELWLSRSVDTNLVGSSLTIGKADGSTSARVNATRPNQIADNATLVLNSGGSYTLAANANDRVGQLQLFGGAINTGTSVLTVGFNQTFVNGTTSTVSGILDLDNQTHSFGVGTDNSANVSAKLQNGTLRKTGAGTLTLSGSQANTLTETLLEGGTLLLGKTAGGNAVGGQLTVGTPGQTVGAPLVRLLASDQLPDATSVTFNAGSFEMDGFNDSIGGFSTAANSLPVIRTEGGTLTMLGSAVALEGSFVTLGGNLNLGGDQRNFYAFGNSTGGANFLNYNIGNGTINNGTFNKLGVGGVRFNAITGNAVLKLTEGTASVGTATFGGLEGARPLTIDTSLTVNAPNSSSTLFSGTLSGTGKLIKTGAGTLELFTVTNTLAGGIDLMAGTLLVKSPTAFGSAAPHFNDFATVLLDLSGQNAARFTHAATTLEQFSNIRLGDDGLVVDYAGATPFSVYNASVIQARNNGAWNNFGIGSSLATNDPSRVGVGVVEAGAIGVTTWHGKTVDATTLLIAAGVLGDTNLDLAVNFDDLLKLAQNYGTTGKSWVHGDTNYDGAINFDDLLKLAQNYGGSLLNDSAGVDFADADFSADFALAMSLVPEPTLVGALAIGVASLRRSRKQGGRCTVLN